MKQKTLPSFNGNQILTRAELASFPCSFLTHLDVQTVARVKI
jgi:hypothetical protein